MLYAHTNTHTHTRTHTQAEISYTRLQSFKITQITLFKANSIEAKEFNYNKTIKLNYSPNFLITHVAE